MTNVINPYELLGVNTDTDIKMIKKKYYELSMLCHPDKGGSPDDFRTVHTAYLYVIEQMKTRVENPEKSYLDLEKEFKNFCEKQTEKPPTFHQIFVDHNEEIKHFNRVFDETQDSIIQKDKPVSPKWTADPFKNGYGKQMDKSEANDKYTTTVKSEPGNKFQTEIIHYKEPVSLQETYYGGLHRFDKTTVSDFSHNTPHLSMTDYSRAYSDAPPPMDKDFHSETHDELITKRNQLDQRIKNELSSIKRW